MAVHGDGTRRVQPGERRARLTVRESVIGRRSRGEVGDLLAVDGDRTRRGRKNRLHRAERKRVNVVFA